MTQIPHHLVIDRSLEIGTYAAVAHGLFDDHMHYRGESKTRIPPGKNATQVYHICDTAHINWPLLLLTRNGITITSPAIGIPASPTNV